MSVVLRTARLVLRPPALDDLGALAEIFADPEVCRFIGDGRPRSPERVERGVRNALLCWDRRGFGPFVVEQGGVIIGDALLYPVARSGADASDFAQRGPEIELGYRLARSAWGRGFATEAARAVMDWAFSPSGPGLTKLIAVTYPENAASQRVLEKIGMHRVGETREFYDEVTVLFRAERG